jgi:hypothetical protein
MDPLYASRISADDVRFVQIGLRDQRTPEPIAISRVLPVEIPVGKPTGRLGSPELVAPVINRVIGSQPVSEDSGVDFHPALNVVLV